MVSLCLEIKKIHKQVHLTKMFVFNEFKYFPQSLKTKIQKDKTN